VQLFAQVIRAQMQPKRWGNERVRTGDSPLMSAAANSIAIAA
jgi:hypothetical protein